MKEAGLEKSGSAKMHWILLMNEVPKDNFYKGLWRVARGKLWKLPAGPEDILQ